MIVKKVLVVACAAALMSTPAWALPGEAPSNQGTAHGPSATPNDTNNPGHSRQQGNQGGAGSSDDQGGNGSGDSGNSHKPSHPSHPEHPSHPGKSHACRPHRVAYVASGTLVSETLTKNASGTYSGELTVKVMHANRHAAGDVNPTTPKDYKVENARVTFHLADVNNDGSVGVDDLKEDDRVKLIGGITRLAKRCNQEGFTATTTIRRIVFRAPRAATR